MLCTTNEDCSNHGVCNETCDCFDNYKGDKCDECISDDYQKTKHGYCAEKCDIICDEGQSCEMDPDFGIDLCVCDYQNANPEDKCQMCFKGYLQTEYDHCQPEACVKKNKLCSNQGDCEVVSGQYQCVCLGDFAGTFCDECTKGLTKARGGKCLPDECVNKHKDECSEQGVCISATRQCTCNHGYAGKSCFQCASGFKPVEKTYSITCYPDICFVENNPKICSGNGKCITQGTETFCECDRYIAGLQCQDCATGYEKLPNGLCVSDLCVSNGLDCANHGICNYKDGSYYCKCWPRFDTKQKCSDCIVDFVMLDNDCISIACVSNDVECSQHGYCDTKTQHNGVYQCICEFGYTGEFCTECTTGYLAADNGDCISPKCVTNDSECSNNGKCNGSKKAGWSCGCNIGASGEKCENCSREYQKTTSGKCVIEDCFADNQECGGNGVCESLSFEHKCNCNENFTVESRCVDCVVGFSLMDGACVIPDNQLSGGAIAGIVIAIVVAFIAVGLGIWFVAKAKKAKINEITINEVPKDKDFGGAGSTIRSGSNNFI